MRIVPARSSTVNWMCARFEPVVEEVRPLALGQGDEGLVGVDLVDAWASWSLSAVEEALSSLSAGLPRVGGDRARIPRAMGTSVGVKEIRVGPLQR